MYIKKIILEGFKSYGRRIEIDGFDPEFNAITGLNGTGKWNVLNSIYFVLGMTDLSEVRVKSLSELIYLQGQDSVKTAKVTIVFDNSNPNQRPMGYENTEEIKFSCQINLRGRNEYFINGKVVLGKKLSDFFCSIKMNVNNPDFIIMQGKITKVLNMKPHEILSMVKEAAGTSLYESYREVTTKVFERKESKIRESIVLLEEEMKPKLETLRQERSLYHEYQRTIRDIDFLNKIVISDRYVRFKAAVENNAAMIQELRNRMETFKKTIQENNEKRVSLEQQSEALRLQLENEEKGELSEIEKELKKMQQTESTMSGKLKADKESIESENRKLKTLQKDTEVDKKVLQSKENDLSKKYYLFQNLKEVDENDAAAYEAAKKRFEAISQGLLTTEDGQAASLRDQFISTKQQISEAETKIKIAGMELKHKASLLKQKEGETPANDDAYIKDECLKKQLEPQVAELVKLLRQTNYEEGSFETLLERKTELQRSIRTLKQNLDNLQAYAFELGYEDPEANFDLSKVHPMVGKLVTLREKNASLALSVVGGSHLRSYVTDDEILQKGQSRDRVAIIPINKISSQPIKRRKVNLAQNLVGRENMQSTLSLIDYDPYFAPVLNFVFGGSLVARDLDTACRVTHNDRIRCRTVTMDGDVVDPEGTLSGGSKPKGSCLLDQLAEINKIENELTKRMAELQEVENKLSSMEKAFESYGKLKRDLEMSSYELLDCKNRLAQTTYQQHQDEITSLKESIESLQKDIEAARETRKVSKNQVNGIQEKLSDAEGYRKRELKAATDAMKAAKTKSETARKNWQKHEQDLETLKLEIEDLKNAIEKTTAECENVAQIIEKNKADFESKKAGNLELSKRVAAEGAKTEN